MLAKLGGEPVIDRTMASRTMAFDLEARRLDAPTVLGALDIDPALWSPGRAVGTTVGTIARRAWRPSSACRRACASSPAATTRPARRSARAWRAEGLGLLSTGTADVLSTAFARSLRSPTRCSRASTPATSTPSRACTSPLPSTTPAACSCAGTATPLAGPMRRRRDRVGIGDPYELIDRRVADAVARLLILPHFNGSGTPVCDTASRGAIVGLTLSSTRHDIARALLECQSFELALNVEALARAGVRLDRLVAVGGGARSPLWLQIKADVLGRPIAVPRIREGACFGAALLAGAAAGAWAGIDEAVGACVRMERSYEPVAARQDRYRQRYELYKELYPALAGINRRLR